MEQSPYRTREKGTEYFSFLLEFLEYKEFPGSPVELSLAGACRGTVLGGGEIAGQRGSGEGAVGPPPFESLLVSWRASDNSKGIIMNH